MRQEPRLYSYVVEHDNGHAPNPYFGVCTLCRCKFRDDLGKLRNVVELAEEGDWIVGTGGANKRRSAGHGLLVYAMRVDEKLKRGEYYADARFEKKKPLPTGTYAQTRGDNSRPNDEFEKREQFALIPRGTFTTSARTQSSLQNSSQTSKRMGLGSKDVSSPRTSDGSSNGSRTATSQENKDSRASTRLSGKANASRLAKSWYRHRLSFRHLTFLSLQSPSGHLPFFLYSKRENKPRRLPGPQHWRGRSSRRARRTIPAPNREDCKELNRKPVAFHIGLFVFLGQTISSSKHSRRYITRRRLAHLSHFQNPSNP